MTRMKQVGRGLLAGLIIGILIMGGHTLKAYAEPPLVGEKTLIATNAWTPAIEAGGERFLVVFETPQPGFGGASNVQGKLITSMSDLLVFGDNIPLGAQEVCKADDPEDCSVPNQHYPKVGYDHLDHFWVAWADDSETFLLGPDYSWSIYGTRVDSYGVAEPDFPLETAVNEQNYPAVSPDAELFAWSDSRENPDESRIMGCMQLMPEFLISPPYEQGQDQNPAVGYNGTNYLTVWKYFDSAGLTTGIYGQVVGPTENLIGIEFLLDSDLCNRMDVSSDLSDFLVVWDGYFGAYRRITCQRVSSTGAVVGYMNTWPSGTNMFYPAVAFDGKNYLVVWEWRTFDENRGIWGWWVSKDNERLGDPFQIAAFAPYGSTGYGPDVAFCPSMNRYLVVWSEDMTSLYGQLIEPAGPPRLTLSEGPVNPQAELIPPESGMAIVAQLKLSLDSTAANPAEIASMSFTYTGDGDMATIKGRSAGLLHDPTCGGTNFDFIKTADFVGNRVTFEGLTETISPATETCYAVYYAFEQGAICPCSVYGAAIIPDDIQATLPDASLEMAGGQVVGTVQVDYPGMEIIGNPVIPAKQNELLAEPLSVRLTHPLTPDCRELWQVRFTIDQVPPGAVGQSLGCGGPDCVVPFDNMGEAGTSFFTGDQNGTYVITAVLEPTFDNPFACPPFVPIPLSFNVEVECYLLTTGVVPQGAGSIDQWPFDTCYDAGETVSLTALPGGGYIFDHWEGAVSGNVNPGLVTMTEDKHVTAVFVPGSSSLVADFSAEPVSGPVPLEVQFTDLSTGAVTGWRWDFGDGEASTDQHPTHIYQTAGVYTVGLTVAGPGGADTETKIDYITVRQVMPLPDIQANGSDGPVVVSASQPVSVTIGLNPGEYGGFNADWWVAVHTPFAPPGDWYSYVYPTGWQAGVNLCAQTALFAFSGFEVLNAPLSPGDYTFYFALDPPDGHATGDVFDSVVVQVTN